MSFDLYITGGYYHRRGLRCPSGEIRPAMARMRESLFAFLEPWLENASFADIFSGSGVMALEAASRGARRLTLVENDRCKKRVLKENLKLLQRQEHTKLVLGTAESFLRSCTESYDIIYLDPPFAYTPKESLLQLLANSRLLKKGSLAIIHHPTSEHLLAQFQTQHGLLKQQQQRRYGGSTLTFFLSSNN